MLGSILPSPTYEHIAHFVLKTHHFKFIAHTRILGACGGVATKFGLAVRNASQLTC
jgi:hypothetical protein